VEELPDAKACPIHIVKQATIKENGNESIKHRPCYDLSYNSRKIDKSSINDRIIEEEMNSIQYAFALWRILYFILALRQKYLLTLILLLKFDVDGAFKRISLNFLSAMKTIITLGSIA